MTKRGNPRHGSMQFWPRKRAKRQYARVRTWPKTTELKFLGFAGYKVGMTHSIIIDNKANSITKGESKSIPITIIECPPLKIASIRFYKTSLNRYIASTSTIYILRHVISYSCQDLNTSIDNF